ncbi:hypothetical protein M409DRAFT_51296 [Zasmidium cellare ATCC 36951]|uniref:Uncharacterized protein n=1 Tax=Zasmidium cellare ATCC 36951 TaxID=1080233 RepID=A0A6A6CVD4_ZASCE|nr:uncharacterized protein M409DRAFT_51296 [Zasmidium cellare ATCC 36951]KAF2171071.1 hypothetical protein M409DRAFT_51296 [Zasmidium cellare ATCC 36951]
MAAKPAPAPAANVALDVGMTFDTEQSPLFQRVFNTLSVSPLLIQLREDLTEMAQRAPRQDRTHWKRNASDDDSIVKLYDLSNINSMRLVHVLNWDRFGDRNVFAQEVNAFMRHLRSPMADSHSRIVILNRYQGSLLDFETALHLHIMIVELEVPIDMAAGLLHLCQGYLGPGNTLGAAANLWAQVLPLGHVRFGKSYLPPMNWNISAVDLKMCNFSGRSAHTVNALERHEDDQWFARRQVPPPRFQRTDTRGVVSNALNRWPASNLEAYLAVDEDDSITRVAKGQPTSHWLNAVIRTIAFRYSCRPSNLRTKLSSMEDDEFEAFCDEVATEHQAAKLDLFKIESFLARHRDLDRSNCASALQSLAVTVEYLRADYENICASFERRSTLRSLEMARRSIDESRATIRCKVRVRSAVHQLTVAYSDLARDSILTDQPCFVHLWHERA